MTVVYEFYQYRIARPHSRFAIRTAGNGGSRQRAATSFNRRGARPLSGTSSHARPYHAPEHA
eukprot:6175719-Pleurochrysis_carterae.AAC.1